MKSRLTLSIMLILSGILFCPSVDARSLDEIRQSKEIRIGISPIHPSICSAEPPGCRTDCRISGPAYDLAMAFVSTLGKDITPRFIRIDWDEQFFNTDGKTVREAAYTPELLSSGQVDLYPSNLSVNEWRSKKLDFVTLFPSRRMVIINRSRKADFRTPVDLAGKTAAIEKDTSYHTWMQEQNQGVYAKNPIIIRLVSTEDALNAVDNGEMDFTMIDSDAAIWAVRYQYKQCDMAFPVGATDENGWAFRKEDKDLQDAVRTFFKQQRADDNSALNRIWQQYYGMSMTQFIQLVGSISK